MFLLYEIVYISFRYLSIMFGFVFSCLHCTMDADVECGNLSSIGNDCNTALRGAWWTTTLAWENQCNVHVNTFTFSVTINLNCAATKTSLSINVQTVARFEACTMRVEKSRDGISRFALSQCDAWRQTAKRRNRLEMVECLVYATQVMPRLRMFVRLWAGKKRRFLGLLLRVVGWRVHDRLGLALLFLARSSAVADARRRVSNCLVAPTLCFSLKRAWPAAEPRV